MSRTFEVTRDEIQYRTVTYRVEADSFEEARDLIYRGCGDQWDSDYYDSELGEITNIECRECGETDEDECECDSSDVFAELGL